MIIDDPHSALSPTPPFPREAPRLRLAGVLVPIVAVTLFTSPAIFMKATYAWVGFGFFGDPLIWRGLDLLNRKVPNWQKYLELEKYFKMAPKVKTYANFFKFPPQRHSHECSAHHHPTPYRRSEQSSSTPTSSFRRTSSF